MDDPNAPNDPTARVPVPPLDALSSPPPAIMSPTAPTTPPGAPSSPTNPPVPPTSSWAQPSPRRDGTPVASIIAGLVLLGLGLWFFAEYTLGLDMPTIRWSQLWPLILIGVGALVLVGARRDRH